MVQIISQNDPMVINESLATLREGGIIVYPTDTLYGFGADATNDSSINRINRIKGRFGPLSVMSPDVETALSLMAISHEQHKIVEPYLGGAKTLIVAGKPSIVSAKIFGIGNTLGIRVPDNTYCNKLSFEFGKPIISTSVNRAGDVPMNDPRLIEQEFSSEVDLIIDGGTLIKPKGSTIYQYKDNNINILRK